MAREKKKKNVILLKFISASFSPLLVKMMDSMGK